MPDLPSAAAHNRIIGLDEGGVAGFVLAVMFAGAVIAFRLCFAAVDANRDRA